MKTVRWLIEKNEQLCYQVVLKGMLKNFFYILICAISFQIYGQTKVSNASGNWGTATIWTPNGVPTATDDVLISDGQIVSINVSGACKSIKIGNGGAATELRYTGNVALTMSVTNNLTVSTNGTFRPRTTSNANHTLTISGDIINYGVFDFARDANSTSSIIFNKNGNQTFSGNGITTDIASIIVDMGTSISNVLDIQTSNFTAAANFLNLRNGIFKLSTINAVNVVPFTVIPTIPVTAGLWVNSANAIVTSSTTINLNGKIAVSAGILTIGNANNEDIISTGGTVSVSGGTLNIAGKYNGGASASSFSLSGGSVNLPTVGTTNVTLAPFNVTTVGSRFDMTGGILTVIKEGGGGTQDLGFVNTGSTLGTVSGGTIQLGSATTPVSQTLSINSSYIIPNLVVASANVTAKIITNNLNVLNHVSINAGSINANNLGISLGGNWSDAGTFVPGSGTVTFSSSTAQSLSKTGGETFNNVLFSGSGLKSFGSAISTIANFSIASGSSVDVSGSNFQLTVRGNFVNDGSFNSQKGLVSFNGTIAQSIGGVTTTDFYNLTLNNTSGLTLLSNERVLNTLTLSNGTFNTNSKVFTLVSDVTNTARIAALAGTGDISGNVTLQRFAPGGTTGWSLLGFPMSNAMSFNDLDDNIFISCPSCPDGYVPSFTSIYSYNEAAPGSYSVSGSYLPINTINDVIDPNKGYWVYLGTSQFTTAGITLDMIGTVRKNTFNIPLSYSNNGSVTDDGWNLIVNPYPSPISWNLLKGSTANIDNAIYVYNADLNGGAGASASYINGISSPALGAGGIGDAIPMCQGFYVHSTGATSLVAQESIKIASTQNLLKSSSINSNNALIRFALNGPSTFNDETVLYFQAGSSIGFDQQYDAIKFISQGLIAPVLSLHQGSTDFQINGIPNISGTFTMDLKAITGHTGSYTLQITDETSFPKGACIQVYDKFLNLNHNLRQSDYVFNLQDSTTVSRFVLSITLNSLTISSTLNQPSCSQPSAGLIVAKGNNNGPWNYYWTMNGTPVKTSLNKNSSDSLKQVNGANYELQINTVGQCDNNTSNYIVQPIIVPQVNFTSIDTLYLNQCDSIQFQNLSNNTVNEYWDFGDNSYSNSFNPIKRYQTPSIYTITLQGTSSTNCMDMHSKTLVVESEPLAIAINQPSKTNYLIKTFDHNVFELNCLNCKETEVSVKLFDMSGKLVQDFGWIKSNPLFLKIDLQNYNQGIYSLLIGNHNQSQNIKLLVK